MKQLTAALLLIFSMTSDALAWGDVGHRIVAEIAEQDLAPATARQVRELLALAGATSLAQIATSPDNSAKRSETALWHHVNIPVHPVPGTPARYDALRDCPDDQCVVAQIDHFSAVLHDKTFPSLQRLEALKLIVQLVADIHQPLHCGDDGDNGGKDTRVSFLGQDTTLHELWDSGFLAALGIGDERVYARGLFKSITPENYHRWQSGAPVDWANDSYGIARLIYGASHEAGALALFYETDFVPVVNVQLEKAGVRLGVLLNSIFE